MSTVQRPLRAGRGWVTGIVRGGTWVCIAGLVVLLVGVSYRANAAASVACVVGLFLCALFARLRWPRGARAATLCTPALAAALGPLLRTDAIGGTAWVENAAAGYAIFGCAVSGVAALGGARRRGIAIVSGHAVLLASGVLAYLDPELIPFAGLVCAVAVVAVIGRGRGDLRHRRKVRRWTASLAAPEGEIGADPGRGARSGGGDPRTATAVGSPPSTGVTAYEATAKACGGTYEFAIVGASSICLVWTRRWSLEVKLAGSPDGRTASDSWTEGDDPGALWSRIRPLVQETRDLADRLGLDPGSVVGSVVFWDDTSIEGDVADVTVAAGGTVGGESRIVLVRGERLQQWLSDLSGTGPV